MTRGQRETATGLVFVLAILLIKLAILAAVFDWL